MFRRKAIRHLKAEIAAGVDQLDAVIDGQIQQAIEKRDTVAATFLRDTVDGKPASNDPQAISQTLFYSPAFVAVTLPELEEET
jgi:hypothetical protein